MNRSNWHVAILIPARDEEHLLPRCLRSVQVARARLPKGVTSDIVLVSDSSRDKTQSIAEDILRETGMVLSTTAGAVGVARALAAKAALKRYGGPYQRCWLANTDADCEVPAEWLVDQLALAKRGFRAVAGVVGVDSFVEHDPAVEELFRLTYIIHPDGTHPHVHGANLGVRADAYLHAGGWMNLATAEDHDLWNRLKAARHRSLSDATLKVITSGRRFGRAPAGFAAALASHNGVTA